MNFDLTVPILCNAGNALCPLNRDVPITCRMPMNHGPYLNTQLLGRPSMNCIKPSMKWIDLPTLWSYSITYYLYNELSKDLRPGITVSVLKLCQEDSL